MVTGTINGSRFQTALEPDGKGSHWFKVNGTVAEAHRGAGETVTLAVEPTKEWPEPTVPKDLKAALATDPAVRTRWMQITPMARWEWIRWVRATNRVETRQRRIAVALSKLGAGMRRPCCFNTAMCTEPSVSKNGVLLEPA